MRQKSYPQTPFYDSLLALDDAMWPPCGLLWCMRFEGKHGPLEPQAHVVIESIFQRQVQNMFLWKLGEPLKRNITVPKTFPIGVQSQESVEGNMIVY